MRTEPRLVVEGVSKTFRLPHDRVQTLKERVAHPLRRTRYEELRALRNVSFTVDRGEVFGIVGRNGSGKSTLLKLIAGIYGPDAGRILVAGRVVPIVELGVGFNPELPARDNVILNGVMLGLSPREAERRFEAIIDFAELEGFTDLKLRNYSSGMQARLAFAVATHVEADVLLVDEVLAVGDASFKHKCLETFNRMRDRGRTIVLVSHAMEVIERMCSRAMLLESGEMRSMGTPEEVADLYIELNRAASGPRLEQTPQTVP